MTQVTIEKAVLPKDARSGYWKTLLSSMSIARPGEEADSFLVKDGAEARSVAYMARINKMKVTWRKQPQGKIRIWRIK